MTRQDRPGRMLGTLFSIAGGGALGALARYLAGLGILRLLGPTTFPLGIITVNVLGSFLIGFFVVLAAAARIDPSLALFRGGLPGGVHHVLGFLA